MPGLPGRVFVAFATRTGVLGGKIHAEYHHGKPLAVGRTEIECRREVWAGWMLPRSHYRVMRFVPSPWDGPMTPTSKPERT